MICERGVKYPGIKSRGTKTSPLMLSFAIETLAEKINIERG